MAYMETSIRLAKHGLKEVRAPPPRRYSGKRSVFWHTHMLKRIVVNGSKPKLSTIKGPNVEMPPEGMDTAVSMENQSQVLTSRKTSLTWSHRQIPEETPI